jgi:hypothetical protein
MSTTRAFEKNGCFRANLDPLDECFDMMKLETWEKQNQASRRLVFSDSILYSN